MKTPIVLFTMTAAVVAFVSVGATIRMDFAYDGPGLGKGGTVAILVNGAKTGEGKVERTQGNIFSAVEGTDVGIDGETNVSDDYKEGDNKFRGTIHKVVVEVGEVKLAAAERDGLRKAEIFRKATE